MRYLQLCLKGLAIGAANIMPGVSGATLAVIFRVYDSLIEAINNLFKDMKNSLKFLVPLGLGMAVGIIALGSAIDFLRVRFPLQSSAFIAGLMAGSMPYIHGQAVSRADKNRKKIYLYAIAVVSAVVIILLAMLTPTPEPYAGADFSVGLAVFLFAGGAAAAAFMIIPGVSGAMVLVLFGLYSPVMHTISLIREYLMTPLDFQLLGPILMVAAPLGLGIVAGSLLCSRLIALLLEKYHSPTYFSILGLIFGTIFIMFNDVAAGQNIAVTLPLLAFAAVAFVCGLLMSLRLGKQ